MTSRGKYFLIVSMEVEAEKEALFNEVYDAEHLPYLSAVPGVVWASRLEQVPLVINLGGEKQTIEMADEPTSMAIYELEGPEVLLSPEWAEAWQTGRWNSEVRPYTKNRRHVLRRVR
jgi:hypothetical protein